MQGNIIVEKSISAASLFFPMKIGKKSHELLYIMLTMCLEYLINWYVIDAPLGLSHFDFSGDSLSV